MDPIEKLKAELAALTEQMEALIESDEEPGEGEKTFDELSAEFDKKQAELEGAIAEREEANRLAEEQRKKLAGYRQNMQSLSAPERFVGHDGAVTLSIPATVRRHTPRNFHGDRDGLSAEHRAYLFGTWCLAKLSIDLPNHFHFENSLKLASEQLGMRLPGHWGSSLAAHQSNDGSTGSHYSVPEQFGQDLIDLREMYGVARRVFRMLPMTSDTRTDPRRTGGLTANFEGEGDAGSESTKSWDQVRLTAKKLMVLARYSSELNEDSVISIGDDLAGEISYAFANKEDDCGFNGDGTSTYGGILGVRDRLKNVGTAGLVTQASGNTLGAITLADFGKVVGKLPQYADTSMAAWICHRTFYYEVMETLLLAQGGVTAQETRASTRNPRPIFLGYPVEFSQVYPSATATSTVFCTLGDHSRGASFGDRRSESIAFSEHATVGGENVFERDQIAIRGTERFDINVHDVGDASNAGPIVGLQTGS